MALIPSRTKYRKSQKGKKKGLTKAGQFVEFGDYGIQAIERGVVTSQQIEACRVAVVRTFSRKGKFWKKIFPSKPITKKPAETRMGKGKGGVDHWVATVKPGRVLFEVANVSIEEAKQALAKADTRLPVKTKFVTRMERV